MGTRSSSNLSRFRSGGRGGSGLEDQNPGKFDLKFGLMALISQFVNLDMLGCFDEGLHKLNPPHG